MAGHGVGQSRGIDGCAEGAAERYEEHNAAEKQICLVNGRGSTESCRARATLEEG